MLGTKQVYFCDVCNQEHFEAEDNARMLPEGKIVCYDCYCKYRKENFTSNINLEKGKTIIQTNPKAYEGFKDDFDEDWSTINIRSTLVYYKLVDKYLGVQYVEFISPEEIIVKEA